MDMEQDGMAVEDQEHCLPVDGLQNRNTHTWTSEWEPPEQPAVLIKSHQMAKRLRQRVKLHEITNAHELC